MEFTYEGLVRYSYGFYNPNHAAALIVMLLPMFWGTRAAAKRKWIKICVLIPEILLYAALILTYSRAGFIALVLSGMMFFALCQAYLFPRKRRFRFSLKSFVSMRAVAFFLFSLAFLSGTYFSGALSRYCGWIFFPDKSLTNRLALWNGGLQMLADNPLGVGTGLSGKIFTEFYQSPENTYVYRTMVNSFLTFLVEQGVWLSFFSAVLILFIITASLGVIMREEESYKTQVIGIMLLTSCFSAFISGMASTCFDYSAIKGFLRFDSWDTNVFMGAVLSWLMIGILLFLGIICIKFSNRKVLKRCTGLSFFATAVVFAPILAGGCLMNLRRTEKCSVIFAAANSSGKWIKVFSKAGNRTKIALIPDDEVCGRRQILDFFRSKYNNYELYVPLSSIADMESNSLLKKCGIVALTGKNAFLAEKLNAEIILYRPCFSPSAVFGRTIKKIWLDEFDEHGYNSEWERRFSGNKGIVEYVP